MSQTQTKPSPQYFYDKIGSIARKATELCEKPDITERDLALAVELNQQYIDTLREMEDSDLNIYEVAEWMK